MQSYRVLLGHECLIIMMVKVREVKKELVCQHINESLPPNLQNAASIPHTSVRANLLKVTQLAPG